MQNDQQLISDYPILKPPLATFEEKELFDISVAA